MAQTVQVGISFAATTSSLEGPPFLGPGPVVFQYEIERTTEPLSLFNNLPPPLPLSEVRRLHAGEQATSAPAPTVPRTNPARRASNIPLVPTAESVRRAGGREPARPDTVAWLPPTPRPATLRSYPDRVVLTGGRTLACRVLADRGSALRVELDNGVVVDLPRRRIAQLDRGPQGP